MLISFQLKRSKINKNGLVPINMRITLDGKRLELSTHRRISPSSWDSQAAYAIRENDESIILNHYLDALKAKVRKQYNVLESLGKEITLEAIRDGLTGTSEKRHTLVEVFKYHNQQFSLRVGTDFSPLTYKHYQATLSKVESFLEYQYRKSDILLDDLKHSFVTSFELYLKTHDKCAHNTTMKHIIKLKKVINLALFNEWISRNPFANFRCSMKETNRGYLTAKELTTLEEKSFTIPRLRKVKDIFLFCCYTGLSQSDVESLTPSDVSIGMDGEKWIIIYRKKTDTRSPIPILPKALAIIEKYKDDPEANANGRLLPVNSNQRMNGYLKEIADISGITKNLTMHLARHTFATTVTLANGVPIETVSKMLGHTSIKTTQIYSKVVDTKISHDMKALKDKMTLGKIREAI
jgi:site-specific recombinase XerD